MTGNLRKYHDDWLQWRLSVKKLVRNGYCVIVGCSFILFCGSRENAMTACWLALRLISNAVNAPKFSAIIGYCVIWPLLQKLSESWHRTLFNIFYCPLYWYNLSIDIISLFHSWWWYVHYRSWPPSSVTLSILGNIDWHYYSYTVFSWQYSICWYSTFSLLKCW